MAIDHHDGDGAYFASHIRVLAQYYEKHGNLPIDQHGGYRKGLSCLEDPDVAAAVHAWLAKQSLKEMTPMTFCQALNTTILPDLGVHFNNHLSLHQPQRSF